MCTAKFSIHTHASRKHSSPSRSYLWGHLCREKRAKLKSNFSHYGRTYHFKSRDGRPCRWKNQRWGIWAPADAASFGPSASEPQPECRSPAFPPSHRPPRTASDDTEGWSRTCLENQNLQSAIRRNRSIHQWERFGPTWVVSAAPSRVASHPATLVDGHCPAVPLIPLQRVRRQVTHLQLCKIPLEVTEWHPGKMSDDEVAVFSGVLWTKMLRWFYVPELTWLHSLFL